MKRHIHLLIACTLVLAIVLSGCGKKEDVSEDTINDAHSEALAVREEELEFELGTSYPTEGIDLSDVPSYNGGITPPETVEPMYIEKDGYAYQLDPATLQPMEQALDPVTHEPVTMDLSDIDYEEVETPEESPSAVEPTEDNKYPNTGIFLEDD